MDFVGGGHGFESHQLFTLLLLSTIVLVSKLSKLNFRNTNRTDTTQVRMDLGLDDLSYRTSLEIRSLVTLNICETAEQGEIDLSLKKVVLEPQLPGFINHKDDL